MDVAVVAHRKKNVDGGLPELREVLSRYGFANPLWYEIPKSKKAPQQVRRALPGHRLEVAVARVAHVRS